MLFSSRYYYSYCQVYVIRLYTTYSRPLKSCFTPSSWPHSSPKLNYRTTMWTRNRSLYDFIPIFLTATIKSQKAIIDKYWYDLIVAAFFIEARLRHSNVNSKFIFIKLQAYSAQYEYQYTDGDHQSSYFTALLCHIHRHIPNAAQHFNTQSLQLVLSPRLSITKRRSSLAALIFIAGLIRRCAWHVNAFIIKDPRLSWARCYSHRA
jgi:hypothetical protein